MVSPSLLTIGVNKNKNKCIGLNCNFTVGALWWRCKKITESTYFNKYSRCFRALFFFWEFNGAVQAMFIRLKYNYFLERWENKVSLHWNLLASWPTSHDTFCCCCLDGLRLGVGLGVTQLACSLARPNQIPKKKRRMHYHKHAGMYSDDKLEVMELIPKPR